MSEYEFPEEPSLMGIGEIGEDGDETFISEVEFNKLLFIQFDRCNWAISTNNPELIVSSIKAFRINLTGYEDQEFERRLKVLNEVRKAALKKRIKPHYDSWDTNKIKREINTKYYLRLFTHLVALGKREGYLGKKLKTQDVKSPRRKEKNVKSPKRVKEED